MAYAVPKDMPEGWLEIEVDPRLLESVAAGESYGLCISDEKGQTAFNNDVHSREQTALAPYLLVDGGPGQPHPRPILPPRPPAPQASRPSPIAVVQPQRLPEDYAEPTNLHVLHYPGEAKIDPVRGDTLEGVTWDHTVVVDAAANEVVAVQFAIGGDLPMKGVTVALSDLAGPGGAMIPSASARWFREWCVKDKGRWWGEYAVPLTGAFDLPWTENAIPEQRFQPILCDLCVPKTARPGEYTGQVTITSGETMASAPIILRVHNFVLPDETGFEVDFNCYGPVGDTRDWPAYLAREREYYRACHDLRATLNPLGYSQSGNVYDGFAPGLTGAGADVKLADWSRYDEHYSPYLDGSAFTGYRAGVPVTHMYLPLHENWPLPIAEHYSVAITEKRYPEMIVEHARLAGPIETCFDDVYRAAFASAARQIAEHFRDRGWTRTDAQCYLNNKHFYRDPANGGRGTSWWCLDEPMCTDDFLALHFFGALFHDAVAGTAGARMVFRGDISRPQWQRDFLDGLTDVECVSDAFWPYRDRCLDMQRRWGVRFWDYGSPNRVGESNLAVVTWALRAYLAGADGILPWNVVGGEDALTTPTDTALLVPGDRFGVKGPLVSMRAKAFRRGQEDVELLLGLARRKGWNTAQVAEAVGGLIPADLGSMRAAVYQALER